MGKATTLIISCFKLYHQIRVVQCRDHKAELIVGRKLLRKSTLLNEKKSNMRCTGYFDVDQIEECEQYLFVQIKYQIKA